MSGWAPRRFASCAISARNQGISQAKLARATDTDSALTGRPLQPMVDCGVVRRERSPIDRRGYVLELEDQGRETLKRVEALRARVLAQVVGKVLRTLGADVSSSKPSNR